MMNVLRIDKREEHVFTHEYLQPDEYHFCQDSILLAEFVASQISGEVTDDYRALDICAGCGVVGLEIAHRVPGIKKFDFIEIQPEFEHYFNANRLFVGREQFRFLNINYSTLLDSASHSQYDLIVANPPYFVRGEGKLSNSSLRDRCRFFLDSDFGTLLKGIANALKAGGRVYILVKSGDKHGRDVLRSAQLVLLGELRATIVADIRGTFVMKLEKPL